MNNTSGSSRGERSNNSNRLVSPGSKQAIDRMKYEIANEFGVNLGPDTASRQNGSVGGEITKRLVQMGESQISGGSQMGGSFGNTNANQSK